MQIILGAVYIHSTLGKVRVYQHDKEQPYNTATTEVTVIETTPIAEWIDDDGFKCGFSHPGRSWWIHANNLKPYIEEPIEQKVSNKIKYLWNNSNWVKKNPKYSY